MQHVQLMTHAAAAAAVVYNRSTLCVYVYLQSLRLI